MKGVRFVSRWNGINAASLRNSARKNEAELPQVLLPTGYTVNTTLLLLSQLLSEAILMLDKPGQRPVQPLIQ